MSNENVVEGIEDKIVSQSLDEIQFLIIPQQERTNGTESQDNWSLAKLASKHAEFFTLRPSTPSFSRQIFMIQKW